MIEAVYYHIKDGFIKSEIDLHKGYLTTTITISLNYKLYKVVTTRLSWSHYELADKFLRYMGVDIYMHNKNKNSDFIEFGEICYTYGGYNQFVLYRPVDVSEIIKNMKDGLYDWLANFYECGLHHLIEENAKLIKRCGLKSQNEISKTRKATSIIKLSQLKNI